MLVTGGGAWRGRAGAVVGFSNIGGREGAVRRARYRVACRVCAVPHPAIITISMNVCVPVAWGGRCSFPGRLSSETAMGMDGGD